MRKNKRQLAAGMMASVMVLTTLAGCGASASSNNGKETNAAQTQGQQTTAQAQESQTEETKGEPVEMEWLVGQTSAEVDDNAEVVKMIEDRFNIDLKAWYVDSNKFYENLNVRFAGGWRADAGFWQFRRSRRSCRYSGSRRRSTGDRQCCGKYWRGSENGSDQF